MQYGTRGDDRVLKTSARNSVKIDALGFPRFVIAVLIVVHHFYKGPFGSHFDWAFAGVNFFFVLSGFVVTLSKVSKEWPPQGTLRILPVPQTLLRRVATNYPVYLAAVLLSVCCHGLHPYWWQVGAEVTLTSTWLPRVFRPEGRYYNVPLWFVSALACFWFLEEATFALVVCFWRSGRPHLASCLVFVAWMAATPFSLGFSALSTADFWTYLADTPLPLFRSTSAASCLRSCCATARPAALRPAPGLPVRLPPPSWACFSSTLVIFAPRRGVWSIGSKGMACSLRCSACMCSVYRRVRTLCSGHSPCTRCLGWESWPTPSTPFKIPRSGCLRNALASTPRTAAPR
mmetsp:Transcript_38691/g.124329  ORF Transcript_38691/g.124329 Transcript_38691/m.124329 type:complete len:345 (+) Transcript_38691:60-1094(+)